MSFLRRWWWLLLVLIVALGIVYAVFVIPKPGGGPSIAVNFELRGGFAYVTSPADNKVEVAYLKEIAVTGCNVPQPGTDLNVLEGIIVEPADNKLGNLTFDAGGAVVTIDNAVQLPGSPTPIADPLVTEPPSPNRPSPVNSPAAWEHIKWLPHISSKYSATTLNPNWRNMVDGRLVLAGGRLTGATPSTNGGRDAMFEFHTNDASDPPFKRAMTDTLMYNTRASGDRVVLTLVGARSGITRIVVKPSAPGAAVSLQLNGRHAMGSKQLLVGDEVEHFCGFYQLMQPIPPLNRQYNPYYLGNPDAPQPVGGGRGSPGFYCSGDGF